MNNIIAILIAASAITTMATAAGCSAGEEAGKPGGWEAGKATGDPGSSIQDPASNAAPTHPASSPRQGGITVLHDIQYPASNPPTLPSTLASIDAKARQVRSMKAKFTQIAVDPSFDEKDESSGVMQLLKESAGSNAAPTILIRFDYMEPDRSVTIIAATNVYLCQEGFQPEEYSLKDDVKMQSLLAAFTSAARMQEHFTVTSGGTTNGHTILLLEPMSDTARKTFKHLRLTFSTSTWLLASVHQVKLNGQETTVAFSEMEANAAVPRAQFTAESLKAFAP